MNVVSEAIREKVRLHLRSTTAHLIETATQSGDVPIALAKRPEVVLNLLEKCQRLDEAESYIQLLQAFGEKLYAGSHVEIVARYLDYALEKFSLTDEQRIELACQYALILVRATQVDVAEQLLQASRHATTSPVSKARWHNRMGVIKSLQAEYESAYRHYKRAASLAQQLDEPKLLAAVWNNLADWAHGQYRFEEALHYNQKELELAEKHQLLDYIASATTSVAGHLNELGRFEEAELHFNRAYPLYEQLDDLAGLTRNTSNHAYLHLRRKDPDAAKHRAQQALRLSYELGDLFWTAMARHNLGYACVLAAEYEAALSHLTEALEQRLLLNQPLYVQTTREVIEQLRKGVANHPALEHAQRTEWLASCDTLLDKAAQ